MTRWSQLDRRQFARALGASAAALPFLRMLPSRAAGPPPRRLIVMFTANGTIRDQWLPEGGETDFKLKAILEPLEPHRRDIVVLDGVPMASFDYGRHNIHGGAAHLLTGVEALACQGACGGQAGGYAGGISLDQHLAAKMPADLPFPSLLLGINASGNSQHKSISYKGPGLIVPVEPDPVRAFERLFANRTLTPDAQAQASAARRQMLRSKVLEGTRADFAALRTKLAADDRRRLDADLAAVREMEKNFLAAAAAPGTACGKPASPERIDLRNPALIPTLSKLQIDNLVAAMSCDLTRVGTLMYLGDGGGQDPLRWLGYEDKYHDLAHSSSRSGNSAGDKLVKVNNFWAQQLAYLITRLRAAKDPDGSSLLDNTVVLWGNELGNGQDHSAKQMPFVLAGRAGGAIRTGRFLTIKNRTHNDLLITLANAVGVPTTVFGDKQFCKGPLTELS